MNRRSFTLKMLPEQALNGFWASYERTAPVSDEPILGPGTKANQVLRRGQPSCLLPGVYR